MGIGDIFRRGARRRRARGSSRGSQPSSGTQRPGTADATPQTRPGSGSGTSSRTGSARVRDSGSRAGDVRRDTDGGEAEPTLGATRSERAIGAAAARLATWSLRLLLILAGVVVLVLALGRLWVVVLPVSLGLLLATVLWPPARLFRRIMPAALASLLVLLGGVALLVGLGAVLAPQIAGQSQALADAVVEGLGDLQDLISGPPLNLGEEQLGNVVDQAINQVESNAQSIAGGVLTGVSAAGSVLLNAVLAIVLCFFFLKDGPKFLPWIATWVGPRAAPHVTAVAQRAWDTLSGFIKAQAAVGLVDAIAIGVGLAILGIPLALPLAVLIFFGAFVPIIGAVVTGALAALVALVTNGWVSALIVVGLVLVVQQLEGNVLQPVLVGRALDLHAAVVILAVTAGASLFGIIGAFLAVPVVAVITTVVRYARIQMRAAGEAT
jgi:putative heme transporter